MRLILFLFLVASSSPLTFAQDTTVVSHRKNTIKVDLTHNLIYRKAFNLSWERMVKENQSLAITGGIQEFPKVLNLGENIQGKRSDDSGGYKLGAEYRFYLKKENKFDAPRGLYIGPYFSTLGFNTARDITYSGGDALQEAKYNAKFNLYSLGGQLGYQFIFNDRWSLDLVVVGPSVTRYSARMRLEGDFEFDAEEVQNEILNALIEKFPGLEDLLEDRQLDSSGRVNVVGLGYRYQFLIGYRFGKKSDKD